MSEQLRIDGLKVSRGGHQVIHGISLEIAPGAVTTLLGPNGAGKSTMVLAVGGVLRAAGGDVWMNGTSLAKLRPEQIRKAGVAIVPEGRRLLPDLTVEDNMRVATYSLSREDAKRGIGYARRAVPAPARRAGAPSPGRSRAASSRWSCSPRRSCRGRGSCSSTSSRSDSHPSSSSA